MGKSTLNEFQQKGLDLINEGKSLFVTGKAGTGKTYMVHAAIEEAKQNKKRVVVLAFTGIAAMNAGGVTIHSFFHFGIEPYIPGCRNKNVHNLRPDEINLVQNLDMIVIDEISMVRCDLLDKIDDALRFYRKNEKPFGGVQMIFVGDLYQLRPIADEEEDELLKMEYELVDFFKSHAYKGLNPPMFELNKVQRQSDPEFIGILNRTRVGETTDADVAALKTRFVNFIYRNSKIVTLTTHKKIADKVNNSHLYRLDRTLRDKEPYRADVTGDFNYKEYPTNKNLKLCRNARIIFVYNDVNKRYVNGTRGVVLKADEDEIIVKTEKDKIIIVEKQTWEKKRYVYNSTKNEIETETVGTFTQYPLKLAWAITIHKSQGLTFDQVAIDVENAFAEGQVYVALSRCKTLEGLFLTSDLKKESIKVNQDIKMFMENTPKIQLETIPENSNQQFLNKLYYRKYSKDFLNNGFRICMAPSGYYLMIKDKFLFIDNYPQELNMSVGKIYIKNYYKSINAKFIVHHYDGGEHSICVVEENNDIITIYNSDKRRLRIFDINKI